MYHVRWWRHTVAALMLCLMALGPLLATGTVPTWTPEFVQAACVGPCCLITQGFVELSCGEYTRSPTPTTSGGYGPYQGGYGP
jgi:hypothetical protein